MDARKSQWSFFMNKDHFISEPLLGQVDYSIYLVIDSMGVACLRFASSGGALHYSGGVYPELVEGLITPVSIAKQQLVMIFIQIGLIRKIFPAFFLYHFFDGDSLVIGLLKISAGANT